LAKTDENIGVSQLLGARGRAAPKSKPMICSTGYTCYTTLVLHYQ